MFVWDKMKLVLPALPRSIVLNRGDRTLRLQVSNRSIDVGILLGLSLVGSCSLVDLSVFVSNPLEEPHSDGSGDLQEQGLVRGIKELPWSQRIITHFIKDQADSFPI